MSDKKIFQSLSNALHTLMAHPIILAAFVVIAFLQFFILEFLYFIPRYPLNIFFEPIITKLWGVQYLHYPLNIVLLPKLFHYTQAPFYLFVSSFLTGVAIKTIVKINNDEKVSFGKTFKETLGSYVHIFVGALFTFLCILAFSQFYEVCINRAIIIRSMSGKFFLLKRFIIDGAPYVNLVASVIITTLFAYVIPIIVIDKKKVVAAIIGNFKVLMKAPLYTFMVILIPSLLYVPILLLRSSTQINMAMPEMSVIMLVLSIIIMVAIDAIAYTALTTYYLIQKEQ
ncbi:MAG: hypothetical protein ACI9E5_001379 [Candidatus Omnitrophota bacterium]|jgi:hypothetical protein